MLLTRCWMQVAVGAAVFVCGAARAGAQPAAGAERQMILDKVTSLIESGDTFEATDYVESQGAPADVAASYSNLLRDLYFKKRDLPRMILMGRAGIRYCLAQARQVETSDRELALKLKGIAKEMAYNLSVNAWPGWEEPGIVVTRSDLLAGLDAARLNLRLAGELDRDASKKGNAHWLLGAQYLALERRAEAVEQFQRAVTLFREAGAPEFEHMAQGYVGIARLARDKSDAEAQKLLDDSRRALTGIGSEDARYFADQLGSVAKFFCK